MNLDLTGVCVTMLIYVIFFLIGWYASKKVKKGKIDSVYFQKPSYVSSGDPFRPSSAIAALR
jgi:hypothetical protein